MFNTRKTFCHSSPDQMILRHMCLSGQGLIHILIFPVKSDNLHALNHIIQGFPVTFFTGPDFFLLQQTPGYIPEIKHQAPDIILL